MYIKRPMNMLKRWVLKQIYSIALKAATLLYQFWESTTLIICQLILRNHFILGAIVVQENFS